MLADQSLLIQNEDSSPRRKPTAPDAPEDTDSAEIDGGQAPTVFGMSAFKKRKLPSIARLLPRKAPRRSPAPTAGAVPGSRSPLIVEKRWFKRMDGTAAQQPPGSNTNPTGNLRLSQEDFSIDHRTYFRREFFGGQDWRPHRRVEEMEELWLPYEAVVAGDYLGRVNLRISHQPSRISNQGNVPTVLHWGDLGARLRHNNYVGQYVTLERSAEDEFALTIASQPTGAFLY